MIQDSSKSLNNQKQILTRNELKLNGERERLRKAETRRKIQLGGLIVKAGLEEEPSNILLGLLCDAKNNLSHEKERWRQLGDQEFSK